MKIKLLLLGLTIGHFITFGQIDRTKLPIPPQPYKGVIDSTYKTSKPDFGPGLSVKAPQNVPNVMVVMLDDVGYGQLSCFGGAIQTPNIDAIAKQGITYTNFHTTSLCSPSRASLLTGRNQHTLGMATITEGASGFPNNFGKTPNNAAFLSEILKQNGYNTFAVGKWHLTPFTDYSAAGPFTNWPLGRGFERFYGFLGGEVDQWAPLLVEDNHFIDIPKKEGYHLSIDLVDKAISMIRDQQQANTGRPFFMYLALGACHAPLQVPKPYIERYKGKFNQGWDKVREETYNRQMKLGILPPNTKLPVLNQGVKAWDSLSTDERKLFVRLQETFAGFLTHADDQIGRLMSDLKNQGIDKNTLVIIVSDNGASMEGGVNGTTNSDLFRNYTTIPVSEMVKRLDEIGSESTDPHYPMGWGMAGNTPLKRWKQETHAGGNTDPMIISWPSKIKDEGTIRRQYQHITDIFPTILEATQIPIPTEVNGVGQQEVAGKSLTNTFENANAKTNHTNQYYEMFGNRAIWSEGWKAVANHKKGTDFKTDKWELYHTDEDFSETDNLADKFPEKLKELEALWWKEAEKYGVLPLDDRRFERVADPSRPMAALPKSVYTYYPNTVNVHPLVFPNLMLKSHTITAFVNINNNKANGVLACVGTQFGGWTLYVKDNKLNYSHNYLQLAQYDISSSKAISKGIHQLKVHYDLKENHNQPNYTQGDISLYIDDELVGTLKDVKMAKQYSALSGYGLVIGKNQGVAISSNYTAPFEFNNNVEKVTIELK